MAVQLTSAGITVTTTAQFKNVLTLSEVLDSLRLVSTNAFTDGAGINKADMVYHDEITVLTGADASIDLSGGISHAFGVATFTKVKAILIHNKNTTAGHILQVGAGANCLAAGTLFANTTDIINVGPNGIFLITAPSAAGIAVTAGTADILTVSNDSGATIVFDIVVIGEGS